MNQNKAGLIRKVQQDIFTNIHGINESFKGTGLWTSYVNNSQQLSVRDGMLFGQGY